MNIKPYIEFWGRTPSGLQVWLVDGEAIRDKIDPDFTDYAEHRHDDYVPPDELWIDAITKPGEIEFFARAAEDEMRRDPEGKRYDTAHADVDADSAVDRETSDDRPSDVETAELRRLGPLRVVLVDGEAVRDEHDADFVYGGHWLVYPFIPRGEVWIEDTLSDTERPAIVLHEVAEVARMLAGESYKPAHRYATQQELVARRDPSIAWQMIDSEAADVAAEMRGDLSKNERDVIETLKAAGLYDGLVSIAKGQPSASSAHVTTAIGNENDKRKARLFSTIASAPKIGKAEAEGAMGDDACTCSGVEGDVDPQCPQHGEDDEAAKLGKRAAPPRQLKPIDDTLSHTPFSHDAGALDHLRPDQVPRFLGAITDPGKLERRTVRLQGLHAVQNRVDTGKVSTMRDGLANGFDIGDPAKPPVVTRFNGKNYIADGHHRLAAQWLNGASKADVAYADLTAVDQAVKRLNGSGKLMGFVSDVEPPNVMVSTLTEGLAGAWSMPFTIAKAEPDQQLIFGWASVSERDGRLIVDKQGDVILPGDLEKAAYEYVLYSREHDDMHTEAVQGRLIESMMFTKEKQQAMGIYGAVKDDKGRVLDTAWWCGWKIDSPELWAAHKRGERPELSIGGRGERVQV